jgi:Fe-S-cluster containining protein
MGLTCGEQDAQLAELYARIPRIPDCDGRCWTSCGPVGMSDRERQRIRAAGVRITPYEKAMASPERFWCDALTSEKTCAVYALRPLICRIWGAVEGMPCVYGCVPEGGYLTDAEAYRLIAESLRIGGGRHPNVGAAEIDAALGRGEVRRAVERIRDRGRAGEADRARESVPAAFRRRAPEDVEKVVREQLEESGA